MDVPPIACHTMLAVRGGPIAVLEAASEPHGPAVVLVPGYTGSKEDFLPLLEPLARTGRRVLAYDQRGQFESPGPDDAAVYWLFVSAVGAGDTPGFDGVVR